MAKAFRIMCGLLAFTGSASAESPRIKVLFLGDNGLHKPIERAAGLLPTLAKAGIDMAYTDELNDLNADNLARYDGLIIYANHTKISDAQEAALLSFVENGKGLIALHCASYCFLNSPKYISLVGGQFHSHKTGVFRTRIVDAKHPAMKDIQEFEVWDETYVHHRLTDDRHILMVREEDGQREPWTWVRTQGKGRVFYTASGHDERVFRNADYHRLVIQGIRPGSPRRSIIPTTSSPKATTASSFARTPTATTRPTSSPPSPTSSASPPAWSSRAAA